MSVAVVELEGFQLRPHTYIVKELAFYDVTRDYHGRWSFLPPCPWDVLSAKKKKAYAWLTRNCHGLSWESGELPYTSLRPILQSLFASYTDIYIKGLEKKNFLKKFTKGNILDLNDFDCPKLKNLEINVRVSCPVHSYGFQHCALTKADAYASYIKDKLL